MGKILEIIFLPHPAGATFAALLKSQSKHLKGRFGPRVSDGNVFGPMEVSWTPLLVTVAFFGPKEVSWTPRE